MPSTCDHFEGMNALVVLGPGGDFSSALVSDQSGLARVRVGELEGLDGEELA